MIETVDREWVTDPDIGGGNFKTSCIAMLRVLPPTKKNLATLFVARQVRTWVEKRATSLYNSFGNNVARQVARFLLPVLLKL